MIDMQHPKNSMTSHPTISTFHHKDQVTATGQRLKESLLVTATRNLSLYAQEAPP